MLIFALNHGFNFVIFYNYFFVLFNTGSTLKTVEYKVWNSQGNITETTFSGNVR